MAIVSNGYTSAFTDVAWARSAPFHRFGRFSTQSVSDVRVTADSAVTRGVIVSAGRVFGDGILDEVTGTTSLSFPAPSASPGYGQIIMRRTWGTKVSALMAVPIGQPTFNDPGNVSDQLLAFASFTTSAGPITDLRDRRCWVDGDGMMLGATRTTTDYFISNVSGNFVSMSAQYGGGGVLARAGEYLVSGVANVRGGEGYEGTVSLQNSSDGVIATPIGVEAGIQPTMLAQTVMVQDTYNHLGGVLDVNLTGTFTRASPGGPGQIYALPGSRVRATWIGPSR